MKESVTLTLEYLKEIEYLDDDVTAFFDTFGLSVTWANVESAADEILEFNYINWKWVAANYLHHRKYLKYKADVTPAHTVYDSLKIAAYREYVSRPTPWYYGLPFTGWEQHAELQWQNYSKVVSVLRGDLNKAEAWALANALFMD